jgi:hypothetical protein
MAQTVSTVAGTCIELQLNGRTAYTAHFVTADLTVTRCSGPRTRSMHCDGAGELSSAKLEEALKSQVKGPKPRLEGVDPMRVKSHARMEAAVKDVELGVKRMMLANSMPADKWRWKDRDGIRYLVHWQGYSPEALCDGLRLLKPSHKGALPKPSCVRVPV